MSFTQITVRDAYQLLADDPAAVLIDVRTPEEWSLVGVPVLDDLGKEVRFAVWTRYGTGAPNPDFLEQAVAGLEPTAPLLFICRSGVRSQGAALAAAAVGFTTTYNVTEGFEGGLDASGHRTAGWKYADLPWRQG